MITFVFGLVLLVAGLYQIKKVVESFDPCLLDIANFIAVLFGSFLAAVIGLGAMWLNLPYITDLADRLLSASPTILAGLVSGVLLFPCAVLIITAGIDYLDANKDAGLHSWLPLVFGVIFLDLAFWLTIISFIVLYL